MYINCTCIDETIKANLGPDDHFGWIGSMPCTLSAPPRSSIFSTYIFMCKYVNVLPLDQLLSVLKHESLYYLSLYRCKVFPSISTK